MASTQGLPPPTAAKQKVRHTHTSLPPSYTMHSQMRQYGHTSVTMKSIVHRIVLDGRVVDASLLHIVWCLVANSG